MLSVTGAPIYLLGIEIRTGEIIEPHFSNPAKNYLVKSNQI